MGVPYLSSLGAVLVGRWELRTGECRRRAKHLPEEGDMQPSIWDAPPHLRRPFEHRQDPRAPGLMANLQGTRTLGPARNGLVIPSQSRRQALRSSVTPSMSGS